MLNAVGQGLLTGLVLSTFMGPIFFMLLHLGLNSSVRAVAYLALGTFVSDMLTVLLIYLVAGTIVSKNVNLDFMYVAGGLVLVAIGLTNLLKKPAAGFEGELGRRSLLKVFMRGFLINSTNPNVFFFWFGAVMVAVKTYGNQPVFVLTHFSVALAVVLSTDFLKGYAASLLKDKITPGLTLWLGRISGGIIIYFGLRLIFFH